MIGFLLGFVTSLALLLIYLLSNLWAFVMILLSWWAILFFFDRKYKVPNKSIILQFATSLSLVGILSLVEWRWLPLAVVVLGGILFSYVWDWSANYHYDRIDFRLKPLRRVVLVIWAFNVYTIFTYLFALITFFPRTPFWLLSLLASSIVGFISLFIWNIYHERIKKNWMWGILVTIVMFEVTLMLETLPFGYFVLGFLTAWIWYITQLFIRFRVNSKGIIWRKQVWFLLINIILFILIFYIIKWI